MTEFTLWQEIALKRWDELRNIQASKLKPLKAILQKNNFADIEGSLINANTLDTPQNDPNVYLTKILNYVYVSNYRQPLRILEIGFNWGYSASLLLEAAAGSHLTSIDIAKHWYTPPCGDALKSLYGHRFDYVWDNSHSALTTLIRSGRRFDLIVVDGGHSFDVAKLDIELSKTILTEGGILVVDDTDGPNVKLATLAGIAHDQRFLELTNENIGLFAYSFDNFYCYEQLFYMRIR